MDSRTGAGWKYIITEVVLFLTLQRPRNFRVFLKLSSLRSPSELRIVP